MNFTFVLTPSIDGEWGGHLGEGQWSGMVGMLQRKEIDIGKLNCLFFIVDFILILRTFTAATDFTVTMERSAVMTFAEPITQIYHSLFIKVGH